MPKEFTIIKLGGALLTDKRQPGSLRREVLVNAAIEIRACLDAGLIQQLILVHGVGSFGHPPVLEHRLHRGYQDESQLLALTYTQHTVMALRCEIAEAMHQAGVPVAMILPSSNMTASAFRLKRSFLDTVEGFLRIGMIPLLGGDVLVDDEVGFSVCGGDQISLHLAEHFGAARLLFATDVSGVYDRDPKKHTDALPISRLSLEDLAALTLDAQHQVDASGAMAGKLETIAQAKEMLAEGMEIHLFSMMEPGNLKMLLEGDPGTGTEIVP